MLNKFSFFLPFMIIVLCGCGGTNTALVQNKKTIPSWVNEPLVADTNLHMYGMGIEENRELAIKSALNDMMSKLGITIKSSYESNQEVRGAYSNLIIKNQIKSVVDSIKINNYKIIKSAKISYREYAVILESDKQKFLVGLKKNLIRKKEGIKQEYDSIKSSDTLTRYNTKKELSNRANKLMNEILIISQLDSSFDEKRNLDFIDTKHKQFLEESKNLNFFISGDKRSQKFINHIKNTLVHKGFAVKNSKQNSLHTKISTNDRIANNIVVISMKLSVYDKNQYIGGNTYILKERYNGSMASAYKNASIHFNQDIQELGLDEILGIKVK